MTKHIPLKSAMKLFAALAGKIKEPTKIIEENNHQTNNFILVLVKFICNSTLYINWIITLFLIMISTLCTGPLLLLTFSIDVCKRTIEFAAFIFPPLYKIPKTTIALPLYCPCGSSTAPVWIGCCFYNLVIIILFTRRDFKSEKHHIHHLFFYICDSLLTIL